MYNSEYLCIDKNNKAHEIAKNIVSHLYKYISKIKEKDILFFFALRPNNSILHVGNALGDCSETVPAPLLKASYDNS